MSAPGRTAFLVVLAVASVTAAVVLVAGSGDGGRLSGNATDRAFVSDMTRHHQSAIDLASSARKQAEHAEIRDLAANLISAQEGEMSVMRAIDTDMHHMGNTARGNMGMSDDELGMPVDAAKLEKATPFDRAFMDVMIVHHQGAVRMAKLQLAKGDQPALRVIAHDIIGAQSREIGRMRQWRDAWYGND